MKRLSYRARHRGTKEADLMLGGFIDTHGSELSAAELDMFERLLAEQDIDIMAWVTGSAAVPAPYRGPLMGRLKSLDYISSARRG